MFAQLIGQIDKNSAFVLVVLFAGITVIVTSMIVKRRSRLDISNEFELAKIKFKDEANAKLFALETDRAYKFKQIDQGLITSHKRDMGDEE